MAEKQDSMDKLKQLADSITESKLLERTAEINKENYKIKQIFYSATTEDEIINNVNKIIKNCPKETKIQLQQFTAKYQGTTDEDLNTQDIMAYIDTVSIFLDNTDSIL